MRRPGRRRGTLAAVLTALCFDAPPSEGAGPPDRLMAVVRGPGAVPLGTLSLPRAGGTAAARLCFVASDGARLDAEVESGPRRRTVRLAAGNGSQLMVVQLAELAPARQGIPTILLAGAERLMVTDAGPEAADLRRRRAVAEAVGEFLRSRTPGIAPLLAEAREVATALASRTLASLSVPEGYAFSAAPLLGLEVLTGPPIHALAGEDLSVEVYPAEASAQILSRRPAWRAPKREAAEPRRWEARVTGGREEQLGSISCTREEDGVEATATVGWAGGGRSEKLLLTSDAVGVVRVVLESGETEGSPAVLALETAGDGPRDLWAQPWILESARGRRRPVAIPAGPEAEAERARQAFFDEAAAAFRNGKIPEEDGARILWRWYRILDSGSGRAFLPELSVLADLLASMHPPSFGERDEGAWLGAVEVN